MSYYHEARQAKVRIDGPLHSFRAVAGACADHTA